MPHLPNYLILPEVTKAIPTSDFLPLSEIINNLTHNYPDIDINAPYIESETLLHLAVREAKDDDRQALNNLLNLPATQLNVRDYNNRTPLHYAVFYNDIHSVRELIEQGASMDIPDNTGWSAFDYAVHEGKANIVKIMIESGAITKDSIEISNEKIRMLLKSAIFADNLYDGLICPTENDYILYAPYKKLIRKRINYNQDMSGLYGEAFSSSLLDEALKHLDYTYNMLLDSFIVN
ncbi:Ankyrin repeat protein [Rickettsiales bacterium Ac37b]|nr:Ankyrin repeat protein [Rickettsiales bacterium Ac37b]